MVGVNADRELLFVSYGLGVDSTAMLVGMHARGIIPDAITFADTGSEKPETYAYLAVIDAWLVAHGMPTVTVVRYGTARAKNGSGTYSTLEEQCLLLKTLPGIVFGYGGGTYGKSCSQKWKVGPQERHDRRDERCQREWADGRKVTRAIGYDCGPADSKRSKIPETKRYQYWYPLREWGWDRGRCKAEIEAAGLPVPPKSACWFCPVSKPHEVQELVERHPEYRERILAIEAAAVPALTRVVEGLWGRPVKSARDPSKARPGSWTEFLTGVPLATQARENRVVIDRERMLRKVEAGRERMRRRVAKAQAKADAKAARLKTKAKVAA